MKDITKLVLAGLTGYFIGFYEMKYKTMKEIIKVYADESETSDEKETKE